jgi:hypothetical protein
MDQTQEEHPLSEKQTNTDDNKLATVVAAVTDPKFPLPVLDEKSTVRQYVLSFGTLLSLLASGIFGAWYFLDIPLLQSQHPVIVLSVFFFGVLGALFFTGTVWIDWYVTC